MIAITIGAVFGFIVGLTSVGSGTFFGLALLLLFPLSATRMVGTDLLHAALLLFIAGAGHLLHGNVDLHAMSWLLVGSIPGVLIGSHLSIKVPDRRPPGRLRLRPRALRHQAREDAGCRHDHPGRRDPGHACARRLGLCRVEGAPPGHASDPRPRPCVESRGRGPPLLPVGLSLLCSRPPRLHLR